MHYSQAHAYDGGATVGPPDHAAMSGGPHEKLLRQASNDLCLSCHNDQAIAPDVSGDDYNANPLYPRQAGGLTDSSGDWLGHTLGVEVHLAPGYETACSSCHVGTTTVLPDLYLSCIDCHEPHGHIPPDTEDVLGNGVDNLYKNLRAVRALDTYGVFDALLGVTYDKSSGNSKDVFLHYGDGSDTVSKRYSVGSMDFNEPASGKSGMGEFCAMCHGLFHGASTDGYMKSTGGWLRHPTADANISAISDSPYLPYSGIDYKVKVMDSDGDWANPDGDETPTCTTCHKAHGNNRPFGLIYAKGDDALGEDGDGTQLRDLCKQCHVQGD
jgi:predicted CXXCH cytochrome family protein